MLVMGPWNHGGFRARRWRQGGQRELRVEDRRCIIREKIEFPFFLYYLKGRGDGKFPKAYVFQTGMNQWRKFDAWPPRDVQTHGSLSGREGQAGVAAAQASGVR